MSAANRANILAKLQKVSKKFYDSVKPANTRSTFDNAMFACLLENATFEAAEEAMARLQSVYFDWNEIRVTTVPELCESLVGIPDASAAATRLKESLQAIFETHYSFDIEFLRKENLGKALELLGKYRGVSPFVASYIAQSSLSGHSIPIGDASLKLFYVIDYINFKDFHSRQVPGLERAIPKTKGVEFFVSVHQLACSLFNNPTNNKVWQVVTEIEPQAKSKFDELLKLMNPPAAKPAPKKAPAKPVEPPAKEFKPNPADKKAPPKPEVVKKEAPLAAKKKPAAEPPKAAAKPPVKSAPKKKKPR